MRFLAFPLLFVAAIVALADDPVHVGSGKADGNSFTFPLTKAQIEAMPRWSDSDARAISPRVAIGTARNQLRTFVADGEKWSFRNICLFDLGDERWIYVVSFHREYPPEDAVFGGEHLEIPILMDGSTVTPEVVYDERLKMRYQPLK